MDDGTLFDDHGIFEAKGRYYASFFMVVTIHYYLNVQNALERKLYNIGHKSSCLF